MVLSNGKRMKKGAIMVLIKGKRSIIMVLSKWKKNEYHYGIYQVNRKCNYGR